MVAKRTPHGAPNTHGGQTHASWCAQQCCDRLVGALFTGPDVFFLIFLLSLLEHVPVV